MAESSRKTTHFPSTHFLESAGAILFDFRGTGINPHQPSASKPESSGETSQPKLVFIFSGPRKDFLLAKGRRNISEPREQAALRETYEETGLKCHLLPITLHSRATSVDPTLDRSDSEGYTFNEVRKFHNTTDPFMMTVRDYGERGLKVIWWFVGAVDDVQGEKPPAIDPGCEVVSAPLDEALEKLTFKDDRDVVRAAIGILEETLGVKWI